MRVSAGILLVQVKSVMNARTNRKGRLRPPFFYWHGEEDSNPLIAARMSAAGDSLMPPLLSK